jgi:hypothetical protein
MHKFIPLTADSPSTARMRQEFINQHSKLIHPSWLIKEDLDKEVTIDDRQYTIHGLWDVVGIRHIILLDPVEGGAFLITDSRRVANALGYTRMRNLVTGVEHSWSFSGKKSLIGIPDKVEATVESPDEYSDDDKDTEYVDPLVQALLDDITDDGDVSAH